MNAINKLGTTHESQIYMAENMRNFIDKLTSFLKSFDDKAKVITDEDVREFFSELHRERDRSLAEHMSIRRSRHE